MSQVSTPTCQGLEATFGFGDRLGLATPGHVDALRRVGIGRVRGVFAQQSIRELQRTGRDPEAVLDAAVEGLVQEDFGDPWGADADHLKTEADVERMAAAGFHTFTLDPSDELVTDADAWSDDEILDRFDAAPIDWIGEYLDQTIEMPSGDRIELHELRMKRIALKYDAALQHVLRLAAKVESSCSEYAQNWELEVSVDETQTPTSLAEHYIIADRLIRVGGLGERLVALAPHFPGTFEKGVDFIGDIAAFESSLADHATIAANLGPYKLSLHTGSDKLSIYPAFGRITEGRFHVKTSGTSYLEGLRVAAIEEPDLFRRIVGFAREHFERDRASYAIHADLAALPGPEDLSDPDLERTYLGEWGAEPEGEDEAWEGLTDAGRQVMHVTFGSVLGDGTLGPELLQVLDEFPGTYRELLVDHFERHLKALFAG